jgi:prevent-host-death family protein
MVGNVVKVNIQEAKTHFSKLIKRVKAGERVVICDRNVPVAELRELEAGAQQRVRPGTFGMYAGQIRIADDFDAPMPDFERAFYGDDKVNEFGLEPGLSDLDQGMVAED